MYSVFTTFIEDVRYCDISVKRVMEISESAYASLLLTLFSVLAVVGGRPENVYAFLDKKLKPGPSFPTKYFDKIITNCD